MNRAIEAAKKFAGLHNVINIEEHPGGNVNDTFVVSTKDKGRFILQRLNTKVFKNPKLVIANMCSIAEHTQKILEKTPLPQSRRWVVPSVLYTQPTDLSDPNAFWIDEDLGFWRAITYVENATAHQKIKSPLHGFEVGFGLGLFQSLISNLKPTDLHDTLPGFHITPKYLQKFQEATLTRSSPSSTLEENYCFKFIDERASWCSVLEDAAAKKILKVRPIHGDPKTANIMLDNDTSQAVALIDLDTVKPGLVHYDIGDCLRSSCNTAGEECTDFSSIDFDVTMSKQILKGYLSIASSFFTEEDYEYLYDSARLISFELGMRFFTDYLENNTYFKVKHINHNLERAIIQFKLTEAIETRESEIRKVILAAKKEANDSNLFDELKNQLHLYQPAAR
ncbi:MAG: aminoglycoside phosphotransferase family protein [Pseudomonadota bacterium]